MKPETIGPPECPLFRRWLLLAPRWRGEYLFKVMVHHFLPDRQDADLPHDHPWPFLTFIVRGGYDDIVRCACQRMPSYIADEIERTGEYWCPACGGLGLVVGERLSAPCVRLRRATHAHQTRTDHRGAWTLVVTGPRLREWGFWRDGRWWVWTEFEQRFGFAWRCEEPDERIR